MIFLYRYIECCHCLELLIVSIYFERLLFQMLKFELGCFAAYVYLVTIPLILR
ncbi:hypothetical protein NBRC111894_3170 [Sporolactobacillus inulinus]|uniref:Uncharacterized protein n=1 Tax=Sporolactobacillus inulinus TaxID=2078 RepID=A0A4Y1ZEL9_9BACL|nr:hypothetical protein NBRC111894_3170 [Sporolactobacillus inulinus]